MENHRDPGFPLLLRSLHSMLVLAILSLSGNLPEIGYFPAGAASSLLGNLGLRDHMVALAWQPTGRGAAH